MADFLAALTNLTGKPAADFIGAGALATVAQDAAGAYAITHWDASLGAQPTIAALVAAASAPGVAQLLAYASAKQGEVANGGISVNVAASGQPAQMVKVETDPTGRVDLSGAVQLTGLNPSQTFNWVGASGSITLTAPQVQALGLAAGVFVQSTYTILGAAVTAINAGTITTTAEIDALAWPTNS